MCGEWAFRVVSVIEDPCISYPLYDVELASERKVPAGYQGPIKDESLAKYLQKSITGNKRMFRLMECEVIELPSVAIGIL